MVTDDNKLVLQNANIKPINTLSALKNLKHTEKIDKVLIVLLDRSSSMGEILEGMPKLDTAWDVFKRHLMPNMANWSYGVVLYDTDVDWVIPPGLDTSALMSMDTPNLGASTSMYEALKSSWDWIRSHAKQARIILITDGVPTDEEPETILRHVQKDIPIDTVGIGKGSESSYDPEFLKELSKLTGGVFVEVGSVKCLADTILKLSPEKRPLLGTVKQLEK